LERLCFPEEKSTSDHGIDASDREYAPQWVK
jgi:hypothetical protein